MTEGELLYSVKDGVASLVINREAKRNSLSAEVLGLFHEYLDKACNDNNVRAILITGIGERAFCSGADLGGGMGDGKVDIFKVYADLLKKIVAFPKPTVARVNGYCLAGGMGLMLSCDIVIAKKESKFGTPEVNVGLWPMMIGALIFRNAPRKKAMEMILLGERMTADEALGMGLITRVVESGELDSEVDKVLKTLSSKSPIGMKIGKGAFSDMTDMGFEDALDFLSGKIADVASTEDAIEGITAFIEKRDPVFKGK